MGQLKRACKAALGSASIMCLLAFIGTGEAVDLSFFSFSFSDWHAMLARSFVHRLHTLVVIRNGSITVHRLQF